MKKKINFILAGCCNGIDEEFIIDSRASVNLIDKELWDFSTDACLTLILPNTESD